MLPRIRRSILQNIDGGWLNRLTIGLSGEIPSLSAYVMLDNARYHHAKMLRGFLRTNRKVLHLEFLPAYSPELNPIERVWKLTRKICTHNVYFEKLEKVTVAVTKQLDIWKNPNESLRRFCCIS